MFRATSITIPIPITSAASAMGSYSSQWPALNRHHAPRKQQKPPRGAPLPASPWFSVTGAAINCDASTRLLLQYFKCVSWARFCASSCGNARARRKGGHLVNARDYGALASGTLYDLTDFGSKRVPPSETHFMALAAPIARRGP